MASYFYMKHEKLVSTETSMPSFKGEARLFVASISKVSYIHKVVFTQTEKFTPLKSNGVRGAEIKVPTIIFH